MPSNDSYPSHSSSSNLPGEIQIGQIKLDIQLTVNSSYLKPRIEELSKLFSKELDVKSSQISLSNLTSKGNSSLIRIVVVPPEPSTWFSNVTATSIVSRLTNHQVKLPETFGNYQLVNYKLGPPRKRTNNNIIVVIVIGMIAVIIGLSAYGVWLIWKRKQTSNPYKPVDEATIIVAEQELQPL